MENTIYLTGLCPYCGLALDYSADEGAVMCHGCGRAVPTSALLLVGSEGGAGEDMSEARQIAEAITSAEAGLIYVDNYLEGYDWASFAEGTSLSIGRLSAIAESARLKFSSDPLTYALDFKVRAVPFAKKVEGLSVLVVEIAHKYRSDDISDIFEVYDLYSSITKAICQYRDGLLRELASDIRLAEKFGADATVLDDLKRSLTAIEELAVGVKVPDSIEDIEEYKKVKLAKDNALISRLRDDGIDAGATYDAALKYIAAGDIDNGLHLMLAIYPYKDTADIIKKYSRIFTFGEGLYEMAGRAYVKRPQLKDDGEGGFVYADYFSLHEVKDGVTDETPVLTEVTDIIGTFGTKIFFIRGGKAICCYDTTSEELYANVRILDEASAHGYDTEGKFGVIYSQDRSCFYIKKKLRSESKRQRASRKSVGFNRNNNFSLLRISMDGVRSDTVIPYLVDVMDCFADTVFYTAIPEEGGAPVFRSFNMASGRDTAILGADCVIHNVYDGVIIYSVWAPDCYNMDLYTLNIATGDRTLIARNMRDYYTAVDGKVLYTVGGESFNRLYSASPDGGEQAEVIENAGRISLIRSGWIYYKCGEGRNACLKKTSIDGKFTATVADRFEKLIKMTNGYIYYTGRGSCLCMARCDGAKAITIAKDINTDNIIIDDERIYYLREDMERDGEPVYSLYSTKLDGTELTKLCYDVADLAEYTEDKLYICKKEERDFSVTTPVSKKESETSFCTATVYKYCRIDKKSYEWETVATVGAPEITYTKIKTGFLFFRRTRSLPSTVVMMDRVATGYKREGVAEAGAVLHESESEDETYSKKKRKDKKH